jgi:NAD(P)-dependent dehydrogenase (short-subunit alcohol dehydrogenase family)
MVGTERGSSPVGLLSGKSAVITGAGQGLGRAYALHAAREGALLVVNDVERDLVDDVVTEIRLAGGFAVPDYNSVADWSGAESLVRRCLEEYGKIDGLVNNAGIMPIGLPWEDREDRIRKTVDVNLVGAIFCGVQAMEAMVKERSGSIINVTSGAQMGRTTLSLYGATRGATASLTYGWSLDTQPHNIRVNAIWPGGRTKLGAEYWDSSAGQDRGGRPPIFPESTAPLVTYLLSDLSEDMTGQVIVLRGHVLGIVSHPTLTEHAIDRGEDWDLAGITEAFSSTLRKGLQPTGVPEGL